MRHLSTSSSLRRIAVSVGEPAGIGPDVALAAAQHECWDSELVLIADKEMLQARAALLALDVSLVGYDPATPRPSGNGVLSFLHEPVLHRVEPSVPDSANAPAVLNALRRAALGCIEGEFDALVTAPVNKAVISNSGTPFLGHTEYLAELSGVERVVMLLAAKQLRVALETTHLPLSAVPSTISRDSILQTLRIMHADLSGKFGIEKPRISVLGLNPHAGEDGHLGKEELDIIIPAIEIARNEGIDASGPWPADTAFNQKLVNKTDAFLAMYHDQGLPVLKYASFGTAVNITLGLPFIRCSVDHGTAFDIAGTGEADASSFDEAIRTALTLIGA